MLVSGESAAAQVITERVVAEAQVARTNHHPPICLAQPASVHDEATRADPCVGPKPQRTGKHRQMGPRPQDRYRTEALWHVKP